MRVDTIGYATTKLIKHKTIDRIVKLTCRDDINGEYQIILKISDREVKNELLSYEFLNKVENEQDILESLRLKV